MTQPAYVGWVMEAVGGAAATLESRMSPRAVGNGIPTARCIGGTMANLDVEDRVYAGDGGVPVACAWFALCTNPANGLRDHPILVSVPICKRCDDRCDRMSDS